MECARSVYRAEGLAAFYVSYPTTITMTVPFTAVQFSAYEFLKGVLNPDGGYSPMTHVTAGGIAGGIAAAVTTPLDVAKVGVAPSTAISWLSYEFFSKSEYYFPQKPR
jgi:solute carrier family 25 iron transporter 28/37